MARASLARPSIWRDASLARVTLTRFSFLRLYPVRNFFSCLFGAYYFGPCLFIIANLFIEGVFLFHSDAFLIFMLIQYAISFLRRPVGAN